MTDPLWTSDEDRPARPAGRLEGAAFRRHGASRSTPAASSPRLVRPPWPASATGHEFIPQALGQGRGGGLGRACGEGSSDRRRRYAGGAGSNWASGGPRARRGHTRPRRGHRLRSARPASPRRSPRAWPWPVRRTTRSSPTTTTSACADPVRMPRGDRAGRSSEIGMTMPARSSRSLAAWSAPHAVAITTSGPVHTENFVQRRGRRWRGPRENFARLGFPAGMAVSERRQRLVRAAEAAAEQAGAPDREPSAADEPADARCWASPYRRRAMVSGAPEREALELPIRPRPVSTGPA